MNDGAMLLRVAFGISVVLTLFHLIEEHHGKLWRYFGAIAGVRISDWVGRLFFTGGLGVVLLGAAIGVLTLGTQSDWAWASVFGVGLLLGGRVSDWWNSHYGKVSRGYVGNRGFRGNPGLLSSWFYVADAGLLVYVLWMYSDAWLPLWWSLLPGLIVGAVLFVIVIPFIQWFGGRWFSEAVRPAWERGGTIPDWAK